MRVNRPVMKLDGKNIIRVRMLVSYDGTIFLASYAYIIQRTLKVLITHLKTE